MTSDVGRNQSHRRIAVLISGRGSNLQALIDAARDGRLDAQIAVVVSNRPDAQGLERARTAGIPAVALDHRAFGSRDLFERALVEELRRHDVALVCLAGFMRLLGPTFLDAFPNRILNVHPSLLPAFPGVDAQRQAWAHGVRISGATVHLVTNELDGGPIVLQAAVPVHDDDTADTLAARILVEEHRLYPEAVKLLLDGRWAVEGRRFVRPG
jgi:phosphoribosylglycinamide formyltransferase 1